MTDSVDSRILCERLGIFNFRQASDIHQMLKAFCAQKNMEGDVAIEYIVNRWLEYKRATPNLQWSKGSAAKFLTDGFPWDDPDAWPWKQDCRPREPRPVVVHSNPELDEARRDWFINNRPDIAKRMGWIQ